MSITRKLLKGMGLTDDQQDTILDAHLETVNSLKDDLRKYKDDAEKLPTVQKELDDLKSVGDGGWEEKYKTVKKEFDQYKADQTAKETHGAKEKAYRALLQDVGISEKRLAKVLQLCDVDSVELDEKGAIKGADELKESIKADWSDFITTVTVQGAQTSKPPTSTGSGTMNRTDIMNIKDAGERQRAIAENHALFGF